MVQEQLECRVQETQMQQQQQAAAALREQHHQEAVAQREQQERVVAELREQQQRELQAQQLQRELQQCESEFRFREVGLISEQRQREEALVHQRRSHEETLVSQHQRREETLVSEQQQRDAIVKSEYQQREAALQEGRQKLEAELKTLSTRLERIDKERGEHAAAAERARSSNRKHEHRCDALQLELAAVSSRLDAERSGWARESDEAQSSALLAEEHRRAAAMQQLQEEHRRQLTKVQVAAKKAIQKENRKRQEQKHKLIELVRRLEQVKQEKSTAIRLCEENRSSYELRLAELGLGVSGIPLHRASGTAADLHQASAFVGPRFAPASGGSVGRSQELRAIHERLECHAEWLRMRSSGASAVEGPTATSD